MGSSSRFRDAIAGGRLSSLGTQIMFAAAALLASSMILLGINVTHLNESFAADRHTDNSLIALAEIEIRLLGSEMKVRGYAMTGDTGFLHRLQSDEKRLFGALDALAPLATDNPLQAQRYARLRALVVQRTDLYAFLIRPEHIGDVKRVIVDPKPRAVMDEARQILAVMRQTELGLLEQKQQALVRDARQTFVTTAAIVMAAFLAILLGIVLLGDFRRSEDLRGGPPSDSKGYLRRGS
jgi:CHASE3 domain sensor protein